MAKNVLVTSDFGVSNSFYSNPEEAPADVDQEIQVLRNAAAYLSTEADNRAAKSAPPKKEPGSPRER